MNREIEFRGKYRDKWVYGYLLKSVDDNKFYITVNTDKFFQVKEETIGQYTGLKDKNGKKIFEGDIIKDTSEDIIYTVDFYDGAFALFEEKIYRYFLGDYDISYLEVIGNIYEKEGKSWITY